MRFFLFLSLAVLVSIESMAGLRLPTQLTQSDRQQVLETLGYGTSTKFISNPFPLGGYDGLEVGLSIETIDTADLGVLGSTSNIQEDLNFPRLMVGKGLFENLDIYGHFSPLSQASQVSSHGALVRWGFLQASFMPASLNLVMSVDSTNVINQISLQNFSSTLYLGFKMSVFSILFGAGYIKSFGKFSSAITDSLIEDTMSVSGPRTSISLSLDIDSFFVGISVDRMSSTYFSGRLGYNF